MPVLHLCVLVSTGSVGTLQTVNEVNSFIAYGNYNNQVREVAATLQETVTIWDLE